jgi:CubicO group peptidase (beta-lactamase class C family)
VGGGFRGRRDGADRIDGVWRQGAATPLVFVRGEAGLQAGAPAPLTQALLEQLRRESGAPALAAGMQMRGGAPRIWVDGVRMIGTDTDATPMDRWHIGSCTKSMTATLVARLVETGAVR